MGRKAKDIAADIDAILAAADEQAKALDELVLDDVPPHMLTSDGWAERWGCSRTTAQGKLRALLSQGWVMQRYRVKCVGRRGYPIQHYGPTVG